MPSEFHFSIQPSRCNALPSVVTTVAKANALNSQSSTYNDQGSILLTEVGGKIVVVPSSSSLDKKYHVKFNNFSLHALHEAFSAP